MKENGKVMNTKKISAIQLLRIVACLMILVHHCEWIITKPPTLGRASVSIFIVISGFLAGYYSFEQSGGVLFVN